MDTFAIFGWTFGMLGFSYGLSASQKIARLETELERRGLIDKNFRESAEDDTPSDPSAWSAEKKARVEAARKKMVAARWKLIRLNLILASIAVVGFFTAHYLRR